MADEKFVTIPYERWHSYYKDLEEKNKQLAYDLKHRDIIISVYRSYGIGRTEADKIGILQVDVSGGYKLKDFRKEWLLTVIKGQTGIDLLERPEQEKKLLEAAKKVDKLPSFIKWLFKIK